MASSSDQPANRLINEKSPYLQQHAHNPVDWYPWGEEAFEKARREEKPIFLSIGYSTCHWCHVMERESFESEETARLMNELFVNIKVDREERPDVDNVYMTASQAINQSGGWPLSAWLTPDLQPFYVGTYFPPKPAYGRPSFRDALLSLHDAWVNEHEKVLRSAKAIMRAVTQGSVVAAPADQRVDTAPIIELCLQQLERSYDQRRGGFSAAPKFPRPVIIEFLLRYHHERGNDAALAMALHTLRAMSAGGMYDQLGGGFARYSVDVEWRVPHFEKMLYDQGQLLAAYADAYRITGDAGLAGTIRQTIAYAERDLMDASGAFYSAEDADSEGEEGTFYVWKLAQLRDLLAADELEALVPYYGITEEGNFEHGNNVLHTSATLALVAQAVGKSEDEVDALLRSAREKLFAERVGRIRPHRDEKILTAWNGLMISGLAKSSAALGDPRIAELARRAADHMIATMNRDGRLMHRLKDGEVRFDAYLDDYAFL
ncbi:MAG: thioredoxin domain-containing protein, partial [Candidatus Kapaibacterium sp.]